MFFVNLLTSLAFPFFFFNDTATTEIYTLSLHDALPISRACARGLACCTAVRGAPKCGSQPIPARRDRKSTRLNSSHDQISYAVFCLKKKKQAIATAGNPMLAPSAQRSVQGRSRR